MQTTLENNLNAPTRHASRSRGGELRVIVTGGGTGGHTTPAVATIQALRDRVAGGGSGYAAVKFAYIGSKAGVEGAIARQLGVEFIGIETGKLRRSRTLFGLLSAANLRDALRVPVGYAQAVRAVRRIRPGIVLSTGGYVSVPAVLAAAALRIPVVAHEQTVQIGLANKINFRVAAKIAVSVEETLAALPPKQQSRAVVTGNPVRDVIYRGNSARAVSEFALQENDALPTIYVTGGAQGSRLLNLAVRDALSDLLDHCRVIHQCGNEADFDLLAAAKAQLPELKQRRYAVARFVGDEIGDVYALADLIVARSGAGTVTEACALGKPCVFVPLVPTGGDEQTRNAKRLQDAGAAVIVAQHDLTGETLKAAVLPLLADAGRLKEMGHAALSMAKPDAARALAALVMEAANPRRKATAVSAR